MADSEEAARSEILSRLDVSREQLRGIFDPPRKERGAGAPSSEEEHGEFPRSRTMRMLLNGRGLATLGTVAAGLFIARPALALRLLRLLPASGIARMILLRAFAALRANSRD
jgi:hypothetical protein